MKEAKEIADSLSRDEAICLVRCEAGRTFGKRKGTELATKVCNSLREKELIKVNYWRPTSKGRLVVKALT
jgi:hypothetical protein